MKALLLVGVFLLVPISMFAVEIHGNVGVGHTHGVFNDATYNSLMSEINLQVIPWKWFMIYGGVDILFEYGQNIVFVPYRGVFTIGTKVNLTENLYVNLEHYCEHSIYANDKQFDKMFMLGVESTYASVGIEW